MNRLAPNPETFSTQVEQLPEDQRLFNEQLEAVRKSGIRQMPEFSDMLAHDGTVTSFDRDIVEPGLYLDSTYLPVLEAKGGAPDRLSFQVKDMMKIGRDDSRHHVFFGALAMNWFNHNEIVQQQVAIKPTISKYPTDFDQALQEIAIHQHLEDLGIPTLEAAGLLVTPESPQSNLPNLFQVSLFKPLTTMDNINWRSLSMEQRWNRLGKALDTLAVLHGNLIFHGDPDLRNIGFSEVEGEIVVVDTEFSESGQYLVHPSSANGEKRIYQCMSNDFSRLSMSIDGHIFGSLPREERPTTHERFEQLLQHVYLPYYERLIKTGSPYLRVLTHQLDEIMARKMKEALGEV